MVFETVGFAGEGVLVRLGVCVDEWVWFKGWVCGVALVGMGCGVALKDGCVERMGCGFKGWGVALKDGVWL